MELLRRNTCMQLWYEADRVFQNSQTPGPFVYLECMVYLSRPYILSRPALENYWKGDSIRKLVFASLNPPELG